MERIINPDLSANEVVQFPAPKATQSDFDDADVRPSAEIELLQRPGVSVPILFSV